MGSAVINHTIVAAGISLLTLILFHIWFRHWPLTSVYAAVGLFATLSVPVLYRLAGFTLADEMEWLENREAREHEEMLTRLVSIRDRLHTLGVDEGVRQVDMLHGILEDYHSVVETRFIGKKHSPLAYLSAARSVQKHAVQNLNDVVAVGHSLSTIGRDTYESGDGEKRGESSQLYHEQQQRMDDLLAENRQLFEALTDTAVEVANIKSFSRFERIDTLSRLVSLAEIASHTGK